MDGSLRKKKKERAPSSFVHFWLLPIPSRCLAEATLTHFSSVHNLAARSFLVAIHLSHILPVSPGITGTPNTTLRPPPGPPRPPSTTRASRDFEGLCRGPWPTSPGPPGASRLHDIPPLPPREGRRRGRSPGELQILAQAADPRRFSLYFV
jgi:hypothetical protein